MSRLSDAIKEKVVKPMIKENVSNAYAHIIEFDNKTYMAKIKYNDQVANKQVIVNNVFINTGQLGVINFTPKPNDMVIITFVNGTPVVTGFIFEGLTKSIKAASEHKGNSAIIPDSLCGR